MLFPLTLWAADSPNSRDGCDHNSQMLRVHCCTHQQRVHSVHVCFSWYLCWMSRNHLIYQIGQIITWFRLSRIVIKRGEHLAPTSLSSLSSTWAVTGLKISDSYSSVDSTHQQESRSSIVLGGMEPTNEQGPLCIRDVSVHWEKARKEEAKLGVPLYVDDAEYNKTWIRLMSNTVCPVKEKVAWCQQTVRQKNLITSMNS